MPNRIIIAVIVIGLILAGYHDISTFIRNTKIDDASPENFTIGDDNVGSTLISSGFYELSDVRQKEMFKEMEKANENLAKKITDETSGIIEIGTVEDLIKVAAEETQFPVIGTKEFPVDGYMRVLEVSGDTIIRYEDFFTVNGPGLHLYLSKDPEINDFIDLGPVRGTRGNINYIVPKGVNIKEYKYAMYWSVPFGVLFNYVEIN